MSVTRRGKVYYLAFRPFGKLIYVKTAATNKTEAKLMEAQILTACKSGDYRNLPPESKAVCIRLYENQGWELPESLAGERPKQELTLWRAVDLFVNYPEIKVSANRARYESALVHLVKKLGKETPLKSLWVPQLKTYQLERRDEGAAPDTINKELSTLSRLFGVMIELQYIEVNPCRLVKKLSAKSGERQVYLSFEDVKRISEQCPKWFRPMIWTAYYTGMRRGEILELTRKQVNLAKRLITLSPGDTKEAHWKRVPIHRDLVPILEDAQKVTCLGMDKVFVLVDGPSVRPLELETFKNPWPRACEAIEFPEPWPRFHDLRHTWRTNARRSGMDPQIAESIMGHWFKGKSVSDRYGRISDQELVQAIDGLNVHHGKSEIWASVNERRRQNCKQKTG